MKSEKAGHETPAGKVLLLAAVPAIVTWLLIPLAFMLPLVDSTSPPYFDLTRTISQLAYWSSQSGGEIGCTIVTLSTLTLLITRGGITFQRRLKETSAIVLIAIVCGTGGATLNEHYIKTHLKIPRPNIISLAGDNGSGPLGMTAKEFYESGDREGRRALLSKILTNAPKPVSLSSSIEAHWIEEVGYSFPSGHSYSAMFFATFFLMSATTYLKTKRRWAFYLLLPWVLAVCYSRPILRLHTPADITFGSLQGLAVGIAAWAVATMLIRKIPG